MCSEKFNPSNFKEGFNFIWIGTDIVQKSLKVVEF